MSSFQHRLFFRPVLACCVLALLSASALAATYDIEVSVRDTGNVSISGMTFTVDDQPVAATLNSSQNYVIKGVADGAHLVSPFKAGVAFDLQEQSLTLPTSGETYSPNGSLSFTGHGAYTIGGQVYRALPDGTRQGLRNVVVRCGATTQTTDLDGNYAFAGLLPGTYTITPTLSGFQASPTSKPVTVGVKPGDANNDGAVDALDAPAILGQVLGTSTAPGNPDATQDGKVNVTDLVKVLAIAPVDSGTDFAMTGSYSITGKVKSSSGAALAGVKVVCTGSDNSGGTDIPYATATSDASGNYSLPNLPAGDYTVIPVAADKVFASAPASVKLPASNVAGAPNGSATFTAASGNNPSALLPLTYYHVKDSDGTAVKSGGIVMLAFEPNGIVDLYVAVTDDAIAYQGTYAYNNGKLTLTFTDPDLTRNATFNLDPAAANVTIPFKIFSDGAGTSTWTRHIHNTAGQLGIIFKAVSLGLTTTYYDQAMARVMAYAQYAMQAGLGAPKEALAPGSAAPRKITVVAPNRNGVTIKYDSGPNLKLILFGWSNTDGQPLSNSPIYNDPRLNLDCVPVADADFDPPNRRALFITPFFSNHNLAWYDTNFLHRNADDFTRQRYFHYSMEKDDNVVGMTDKLEHLSHPYTVKQLKDDEVTIQNLIDELEKAPGFIYYSSHGASDGSVATGVYLGDTTLDTTQTISTRFNAIVTQLNADPRYHDIINYKAAADGSVTTLDVAGIDRCLGSSASPAGISAFLTVTPNFWEALRVKSYGLFDHSLVYISACETDKTAYLRKAIQARAYFGFSTDVPSEFAGAVFQYFCQHLARRTHSVEEAYYNIIRVAGTRLKIYTEDNLLENTIPRVEASSTANSNGLARARILQVKDMFRGYGADLGTRGRVIPYQGNGWLTINHKDFNPGVVWWHLFGSRWGQDAQDSRDAIMDICWKTLWSQGRLGGLANPGCNAMTSGRVPYPAELSYMAYLLTGAPYKFACPTLVPRWTLNDRQ